VPVRGFWNFANLVPLSVVNCTFWGKGTLFMDRIVGKCAFRCILWLSVERGTGIRAGLELDLRVHDSLFLEAFGFLSQRIEIVAAFPEKDGCEGVALRKRNLPHGIPFPADIQERFSYQVKKAPAPFQNLL